MRRAFIFSGQSNMSGGGPMGTLRGSGLVTNPGSPGDAPNYIPAYQQTAANEWIGGPAASLAGTIYDYPTDANAPCLYNENVSGALNRVYDDWGSHVKEFPQFNQGGALADGGSYGLELSFLYRHLAAFPNTTLAAIKQSLGGTSLRGDWLPNTVPFGTATAGGANTITLAVGNFTNPSTGNLKIRIVSGTGAGQERTCTAYDSGTRVATVSVAWDTQPDNTSVYGIERLQAQILRLMIEQATGRLDASEGVGNWEWGGFIWMQGESGAHTTANIASADATYLSDARALFAWVRALCGRENMPVLVGRISDHWGWESTQNPYLVAAGYPYAALDSSYWFANDPFDGDGRRESPAQSREDFLSGAALRRATQVALGGDENCTWFDNDGYPNRPPYALTASLNDLTAYHWGHPGNLTAGERAFAAYRAAFGGRRAKRLATAGGSILLGVGGL